MSRSERPGTLQLDERVYRTDLEWKSLPVGRFLQEAAEFLGRQLRSEKALE